MNIDTTNGSGNGPVLGVDPMQLPYDIENHTMDDNNVRHHINRVSDTDVWVCYRTFAVGPGESGYLLSGFGHMSVEPVEIDVSALADAIRREADEVRDAADDDERAVLDALTSTAGAVAMTFAREWGYGVQEAVGDALYDGYAGVSGSFAFVGHVEEAFAYEREYALAEAEGQHGVEDETGIGLDVLGRAFADVLGDVRRSHRHPYAEYIGSVVLDPSGVDVDALAARASGE